MQCYIKIELLLFGPFGRLNRGWMILCDKLLSKYLYVDYIIATSHISSIGSDRSSNLPFWQTASDVKRPATRSGMIVHHQCSEYPGPDSTEFRQNSS